MERCGCDYGGMSESRNSGSRLKRDVLLLQLTTLLERLTFGRGSVTV